MCKPKHAGGLGIIKLREQNKAFLHKIVWQLISQQDSLWVQVIKGKYGRGRDWRRQVDSKVGDSALWRALCEVWPDVLQQLGWNIGDGRTSLVWTDKWCGGEGTLLEYTHQNPPLNDLQLTVHDCVDHNTNDWNWEYFSKYLDDDSLRRIRVILPPCEEHESNTLYWHRLDRNESIIHHAYNNIIGDSAQNSPMWSALWKWKGPQRIVVFMWLAILNRLPTRERTIKWGKGLKTAQLAPVKQKLSCMSLENASMQRSFGILGLKTIFQ